ADPNLPMEVQPADTLIWGARDFHKIRRKDDSWIVHGHNIVEQPTVRHGRIALDTGAYATGRLTAMKVDGLEISFLEQKDTALPRKAVGRSPMSGEAPD
ncbi:MAG: hypothetical protein AAF439_08605, partial [Pseudomonadota bacterium]